MRFQTDYIKADHKPGVTRLLQRFAWFPVTIKDQIVWFETYHILQVYRQTVEKVLIDKEEYTFVLGRWINLAKRCK